MKPPIFLSIVMPAYNERPHIEAVIREHVDAITKLADSLDDWEIVCLDDGSQDDTAAVIQRLSQQTNQIRLVRHAQNKGIYQSQTDLYLNARGTHIYFTGSDGQWPANILLKMFPALQAGADLVVGVRQNRNAIYTLRRRFVSYAFNLLPKMLFGLGTRDAGSVKLGVRDVFTCDVISRSPFADAERIIRAHKRGYLIEFVPIDFLPRAHGKAKGATLRNVVASLRDCFRLVGRIGRHNTFKPVVAPQTRHGS
ncbi:MAG TPA: glycosyltransferase family 2 protein [Candidatus Udaeobacter sp.]|nr:glycosyltransferase family 2 protein [Candidatus Udaeobacter sp.]